MHLLFVCVSHGRINAFVSARWNDYSTFSEDKYAGFSGKWRIAFIGGTVWYETVAVNTSWMFLFYLLFEPVLVSLQGPSLLRLVNEVVVKYLEHLNKDRWFCYKGIWIECWNIVVIRLVCDGNYVYCYYVIDNAFGFVLFGWWDH